jgi:polysaccharide biosynthesis protein VpsQ
MITKISGILFFVFLVLVIVAADAGRMPGVLRAMHDFPHGDHVGHVVLFGILAFLLTKAFPRTVRIGRRHVPIMLLAILLFAIGEECSQTLFSTRTWDLVDMACSITGVVAGSWAALRFRPRAKTATAGSG